MVGVGGGGLEVSKMVMNWGLLVEDNSESSLEEEEEDLDMEEI